MRKSLEGSHRTYDYMIHEGDVRLEKGNVGSILARKR